MPSLRPALFTALVAAALAGAPASLAAQAPARAVSGVHPTPPKELRAERRRSSVIVDGLLGEEAWTGVDAATGLIQTDPKEGEPGLPTEVRFLYDDDALYIGARMFDPLGVRGVQTSLARRDRQESGDQIAIVLDPFHDHLSRVRFQVNPSGVKGDMLGPGGTNLDPAWDPVWEVATNIDTLGWTAEFRIPFSQLRYPRDSVQTWGVQVLRYVQRLNESSMYAWWNKQENGGPNRFQHLTNLRITARPARLEILPYAVARSRHLGESPGDPFAKDGVRDFRGGADLKYLLTSNLTLDATVNPDFGQVEADPAVVNLSQYENFFPERRPFFVEGSGIFGFGGFNCFFCSNVSSMSLFYSRRVGRAPQGFVSRDHYYEDAPENATILGAGKITGRTANGWTIGVLDAVTRRESATALDTAYDVNVDGDTIGRRAYEFEQPVEPATNYFVGRVKKDVGQGRLVLGGIATSVVRRLDDDVLAGRLTRHAENVGGDMEWWLRGRRYRLMASAALTNVVGDSAALLRLQRSSARYLHRPDREQGSGGAFLNRYEPGATQMAGHGGIVRFAKEEGSLLWEAQTHWRSPGFEANDIAFLTRADYVWQNVNVFRNWTKPTTWYRDVFVLGGAQQQFNFGGDRTDRQFHLMAGGTAPNYWSASAFVIRHPASLDDRLTRGGPVVRGYGWHYSSASVSTDQRKRVYFSTNPSFAWSETGIRDWSADLGINYRPSSRITLSVNPSYNHDHTENQFVRAVDDETATEFFGRRYVFATVLQKTVSMTTRLNVTFTPNLTFELYAQPFVSSGNHYDFKEFAAPRQERRYFYGVDTGTIAVTGEGWDKTWTIDPDGGGAAQPIVLTNLSQLQTTGFPLDFNTRSLIGNAVVRWEYRPGSTVFFVWSQNRDDLVPLGDLSLSRDRRGLFGAQPRNVFLVKLNYWLAM